MVSFGQDGIYEIALHYSHSLRITDHYVDVDISRQGDEYNLHVKTKALGDNEELNKKKMDTTFAISKEQFLSIIESIKKISCVDIAKDVETDRNGMDGNTCEIMYGSFDSSIAYKICTPDYDTSKRGLIEFYNCCLLIAKTAKLKSTILFK